MGSQGVCLVSSPNPLGWTRLACLFESTSPAHPRPGQGVPQRCGVDGGRPRGARTDQRRFRCRTRDRPIPGAVVCHGGQQLLGHATAALTLAATLLCSQAPCPASVVAPPSPDRSGRRQGEMVSEQDIQLWGGG